MVSVMNAEPIVGAGLRTSLRVGEISVWLGLVCALLAYWLGWPNWVWVLLAIASYGAGVGDGYRWAREQRWMEWKAEHVDPDWAKEIDPKWFDCKKQE